MRRDVLEAAKELILANPMQVDLDNLLVVAGETFGQSSDHAGRLGGMISGTGDLAVWICIAAAEEYGYDFGISWEEAATLAAELSETEAEILFDPAEGKLGTDAQEAVARLNLVLAVEQPPTVEQLDEIRDCLREARLVLGKAEQLAAKLAWSTSRDGATADAWISDADAMVCRALLTVGDEKAALKKSAAR